MGGALLPATWYSSSEPDGLPAHILKILINYPAAITMSLLQE